ncbi:unnamed protein product [Miscanthus lutarioriparius]|uniref:Uncharacterized protein n=1 Tax=Miscanthus lutarioriparius TaxID=422564 RepID=A0A811PNK4_9POAL|nr:unnamed protein product [Miscanthus lutarioriparius]
MACAARNADSAVTSPVVLRHGGDDGDFESLAKVDVQATSPDDIGRSSDIESLILIIQERRSKYWLPSSTSIPALFDDHMMSADAIWENKIMAEAKWYLLMLSTISWHSIALNM